MLKYRHGDRPDFIGFYWHVFWLVWWSFWFGYFLAKESWAAAVIQLVCLIVWCWLTVYELHHMTWHIVEITSPGKGDAE